MSSSSASIRPESRDAAATALPETRPAVPKIALDHELEPRPWHEAARCAADSRVHRVFLVGQPGAGKSAWAEAYSLERTGKAPIVIDGNPETTRDEFWGEKELRGGDSVVRCRGVAHAIREERVLVIEDLNAIPIDIRAYLLPLSDKRWVVNPVDGEWLRIPADFTIIATGNRESMACRRNSSIALAVRDRFVALEVPDVREDELGSILRTCRPHSRSAIIARSVDLWSDFANVSDFASSDEDKWTSLGVRSAMQYIDLVEAGLDDPTACRMAIVNKWMVDRDLHAAAKLRDDLRD